MTPFPRSDYRSLTRYLPDRRPVALDLSDNTNQWGTHPAALERMRASGTDDLARYPELYADVFREAVGRRFGVDPECVTTGAGSDDVLDSAFRAVSGPGASITYASPTFSMIEPLAHMNGLAARAVSWADALAEPARLLEGTPSLVYVCRPNNPTGTMAPAAWVERLLDLAGAEGPLVVLDEAYADFAGESWVGRAPGLARLLVARTLSKAYGLAGLRVGFGVGSLEVALEVEKSRGPFKVARISALAAAAALDDPEGWTARTVAECVANRVRLAAALDERGLPPLPSRANFLFFQSPSGSAREDALALRDRGVAVRPFPGDMPDGSDGLRVTVGPWPLLERFLAALDDYRRTIARAG
jgi:histidinol-phosphate aminotransferase